MDNKDYISELFQKYLDDQASPDELRTLFAALESGRDHNDWENLLLPVFQAKRPETEYKSAQWEEIIEAILHPAEAVQPPAKTIRLFPVSRMAAAAVIALVITSGILLWQNHKATNGNNPATAKQDVAPIGNRAVLTLADGSTILLDSSANGLLAQQSGTQITKSTDGQITYQNPTSAIGKSANPGFNSLTTPRGGKYKLALPDGTIVWLNAATTMRYPVSFPANERKVEIKGEAYFEVAANAKSPFKVISDHQEIRVLGTEFNINAYPDEADTKTTLIQGSIQVSNQNPTSTISKSANLLPGQQAQVAANKLEVADKVDLQQVVAWKNGQLAMQNLDLKAVMRQISRWYDVEVVFEGPLPTGRFGGILDQKLYLSNIMEVLEERGIRCRLDGQKLYVSAK